MRSIIAAKKNTLQALCRAAGWHLPPPGMEGGWKVTVILKMTITWGVRDHGGGRGNMIGQESLADGGRLGGGAPLARKTRPYHDAGIVGGWWVLPKPPARQGLPRGRRGAHARRGARCVQKRTHPTG
jgi:hypothetical protein